MSNDNRMDWIRNIEKIKKSPKKYYTVEHEIATECHISGVLDYGRGVIRCGVSTIEKDKNGLYRYFLKIKYASPEEPHYNQKANKKGYYFKDGIVGELLSLFSVFFRCRFYLVSNTTGELTKKSLKIKTNYNFLYNPCNPKLHPPIFSNSERNFIKNNKLPDFLNEVKLMKPQFHQPYILACYHYLKSLKEVGIDYEMIFIRLVSSVESLSKSYSLNKKDDPLYNVDIRELCKYLNIEKEEENDLVQTINNRKSKIRFVRFVEKYSKGYLKGGPTKAKHCRIRKANLLNMLKVIYDARSNYLHSGEPMYLSQIMRGQYNWDTDPSLGMIIDNRKFSANQKLPYAYFFEGLVRHCLINFLKEK